MFNKKNPLILLSRLSFLLSDDKRLGRHFYEKDSWFKKFDKLGHLVILPNIKTTKEIPMKIQKWSETPVMETAHGVDARNLYNTPEAMITVITLQPGESLKRHITPVDVAFYVLEGVGVVEVGDEKLEVGKDTLVESPKDILHCWYNESDAPLRFMVVKAPRPAKKTVFVGG